jgi:alpha-ribazole phosphatase
LEIYLIRHTKTSAALGLCYGQSDIELAKSFPVEAQQIRSKLPEVHEICKIYSSPLSRCLQLANTFSDSVITDSRLLEINFGSWEMRYFNEIESDKLKHWSENFVDTAPPDGESFADIIQRVGCFWEDLTATKAEQVFVITHAGVIRALLSHILNLPAANAFQFQIDTGSVHKLVHINNYTCINGINL